MRFKDAFDEPVEISLSQFSTEEATLCSYCYNIKCLDKLAEIEFSSPMAMVAKSHNDFEYFFRLFGMKINITFIL